MSDAQLWRDCEAHLRGLVEHGVPHAAHKVREEAEHDDQPAKHSKAVARPRVILRPDARLASELPDTGAHTMAMRERLAAKEAPAAASASS